MFLLSRAQLSAHWRRSVSCPICKESLREEDNGALACSVCGGRYPISEGVPKFVSFDEDDSQPAFISIGQDFRETILGRVGIYMARRHYLHVISNHVPPGRALIELGSGGGSSYLGRRYDALGIDLSFSSAQICSRTYGSAIQAAVSTLPLGTESADAIVSSCLLEHLDDTNAGLAIAEMQRVLRPGGVMVHFFDVDTDDGFFSWAKNKRWYTRVFVTSRGHFGLRPWERWIYLFEKSGFQLEQARLFCKGWLQDGSTWAALRDREVPLLPRAIAHLTGALFHNRLTSIALDCATTLMDDTLGRYLPQYWASKAIAVFRRMSERAAT